MPRTSYVTPKGQSLTVTHPLGSGQFGVAHAVKNRRGDVFCIKEIPIDMRDEESKAQVHNEVQMMKDLCKHPNMITYYDSWFERKRMCILMEYAPNGSLDRLIHSYATENKRFPETKVTHFLQELSGALRYCHEELHVIHRDIKPANILIDQLGTLKLADFGLSKSIGLQNDLCATFCGSPLYMSPEQCQGVHYSYPTDVWALGCVVFEIMALCSPWLDGDSERRTYPALIMKITSASPNCADIARRYSSRLVEATKWMLHKMPYRRATAAELVSLLEMRPPPMQSSETLFDPSAPPRSVVHPVPTGTTRPGKTLDRQHRLIQEARALAAAQTIQKSFRVSVEQRRQRDEMARLMPMGQMLPPLRPVDRPPVYDVEKSRASLVIQNAFRASLKQRRATPRAAPRPRSRLAQAKAPCSSRLTELAQPRVRVPPAPLAPRRVPSAGLLPSVKPPTPRKAWL